MIHKKPEKYCKINHPVILAEGKIENFPDFLNLLFEYCLFFRWIYFKNRPRGNLLLLRSALIVGIFSFTYYTVFSSIDFVIEGIELDPVLLFAGSIVAGFLYMTHIFHNKSEACGHMYTEMIKSGANGDIITAKSLSNALAIELLTLDLWAHRKYRLLFARNIYRAIEHAYSDDSYEIKGMELPQTMDEMVTIVNSGHLQAKEARLLLDNYQDFLMYKSNMYYSKKEKEEREKGAA